MIDFRRRRIAVVVARIVLHAGINLQAVNIRIEIAHMLGIAVSETSSGESLTVVVDHHRAKHNLVATVHIDIGYCIVVVALTLPRAVAVVVPAPALRQLVGSGINVVGNHLVAGVDTACQEDAGLAAIEIRCTEEVLRTAVSIAVAPGAVQVALARLQTLQRIGNALIGLTRETVHIDKVFAIGIYKPVDTASCGTSDILRGIAHGVGSSVSHVDHGAVSSTHHHFCPSVLIPVVTDDVLFVVLEVAHVRTAVHPPQTSAVELQTFEDGVFALIAVTRIAGIHLAQVVELHQNLQLAIAVDIGTTGIVRDERALDSLVRQLDFLVAGAPGADGCTLLLLFPTHHSCHGVAAGGGATLVGIVGDVERLIVQLHAVAIDVILGVVVFLSGDSPTEEHAA